MPRQGVEPMAKKFIIVVLIVITVSLLSIPMKLINSGHSNKYKVRVMLNNGTEIIDYITKADYDNYLRQNDLQLDKQIIKYDLIYYVVQTYNPNGEKEFNLPIHY